MPVHDWKPGFAWLFHDFHQIFDRLVLVFNCQLESARLVVDRIYFFWIVAESYQNSGFSTVPPFSKQSTQACPGNALTPEAFSVTYSGVLAGGAGPKNIQP